MCIVEQQQLWYDNILSYRTRVEETSLLSFLKHVQKNIDAIGLKISGDMFFSIDESISGDGKTILGLELLVPVDKQFKSSCKYVFKPKFRLENAVMGKFSGTTDEFKKAEKTLYDYAKGKNLKAITDVYYLIKNIHDENCVVDMYLGTSGNSL